MENVRTRLLDALVEKGAIKVARSPDDFFVFKSGRRSPNFISIGGLTDGESLSLLGAAYAQTAMDAVREKKILPFEYVFGPAYKGIPLAALMVQTLAQDHGLNVKLLYDRKEEKAHGENTGAGEASRVIVGAEQFKQGGSILMVDDVVTTGLAKFTALEKLELLGRHSVAGLVLAIDRQERTGDAEKVGGHTPVEVLAGRGIRTVSILSMQDIFSHLRATLSPEIRGAWVEYYRKYGGVSLE